MQVRVVVRFTDHNIDPLVPQQIALMAEMKANINDLPTALEQAMLQTTLLQQADSDFTLKCQGRGQQLALCNFKKHFIPEDRRRYVIVMQAYPAMYEKSSLSMSGKVCLINLAARMSWSVCRRVNRFLVCFVVCRLLDSCTHEWRNWRGNGNSA